MSEVSRLDLVVGKLKLSEAIKIGAKIRPQCAGGYFVKGGSCALGAAYEAVTGRYPSENNGDVDFSGIWPLIGGFQEPRTLALIIERNDRGQSRESIASWLESQGL